MRILLTVGFMVASGGAFAQGYGSGGLYGSGSNPYGHSVQGYTTDRGTYVQPHMQSNSNSTQMDNWSTRGNTNPYTGVQGTRSPRY